MKKNILKILFLIISNFLLSQSTNKKLDFSKDSDTIYWNKYKHGLIIRHQLEDIQNRNDELIFRFWNFGSCIEVTKNGTLYKGNVTYFVDEVDDYSKRQFKKVFNLEIEKAKEIIDLIGARKINETPSDKFILGWEQGFDGVEYLFEYKTKNEYSFKNYWTPKSQDNLLEATRIQVFIDELYLICDSENLLKKFEKEIPFRSYSYNGASIAISRVMTVKEYKEFKKQKHKRKRQSINTKN